SRADHSSAQGVATNPAAGVRRRQGPVATGRLQRADRVAQRPALSSLGTRVGLCLRSGSHQRAGTMQDPLEHMLNIEAAAFDSKSRARAALEACTVPLSAKSPITSSNRTRSRDAGSVVVFKQVGLIATKVVSTNIIQLRWSSDEGRQSHRQVIVLKQFTKE